MSFRLFSIRFIKHGQLFLQTCCKQKKYVQVNPLKIQQTTKKYVLNRGTSIEKHSLLNRILFRLIINPLSNFKLQATRKLLCGNSIPFFSLVSANLASGGLLSKEDELEGICYEIRETISCLEHFSLKKLDDNVFENISLDNLDVGHPIAKGCSAVVYAAKFKNKHDKKDLNVINVMNLNKIHPTVKVDLMDNLANTDNEIESSEDMKSNFPLALKIMFNYDVESNAMSILRAMYKEAIPATQINIDKSNGLKNDLLYETSILPPHPNIVGIYGVFCDNIPKLCHASHLYPMALPPRINPNGFGRNMSLFLLMKRYDLSLREFLNHRDLPTRYRILILAQLLEAITHLNRHGVAHRDLKTDNILVEHKPGEEPIIILSDFGCCIADKKNGLKIPYTSAEIDKGGNAALMAPEIISKQPGTFSVLDYSKSDLWACGTIAYEIFGHLNPFYNECMFKQKINKIRGLPKIDDAVPFIIRKLIEDILQQSPYKRLSTDIAANVVQLYLWAPSHWLASFKRPSNKEIIQWLLYLTTKTVYERRRKLLNDRYTVKAYKQHSQTDFILVYSFLIRARLNRIRDAIDWIQKLNSCI